jgi:hypothetical protein
LTHPLPKVLFGGAAPCHPHHDGLFFAALDDDRQSPAPGGSAQAPGPGAGSEIIEGIRVPDNKAVERVSVARVVSEHLLARVNFSQLAWTAWDHDESEAADIVDPDLAGAFEDKGDLSSMSIDRGNKDAVIFLGRLAGTTANGGQRKQGQKNMP